VGAQQLFPGLSRAFNYPSTNLPNYQIFLVEKMQQHHQQAYAQKATRAMVIPGSLFTSRMRG
jgi:hypothetical protein